MKNKRIKRKGRDKKTFIHLILEIEFDFQKSLINRIWRNTGGKKRRKGNLTCAAALKAAKQNKNTNLRGFFSI